MATITDIWLCSRALIKIGGEAIHSFDEGTAESEVAVMLYPLARDALLSAYPWSFAIGQRELSRLAASPLVDYEHAFQLPADMLRVLSAGAAGRGRGIEYRLHEDRLHTDVEAVTLTYIFRPVEAAFPPYFNEALVARLAAEFSIPLTESSSRADAMHKVAEVAFARARSIDAQQSTPSRIEDFTLIEARY